MKRVDGVILEGEKIGLEKYAGRENKLMVNLHILNGFESMSLRVKDSSLVKMLEDYPDRKPIKVKANVVTFKDELYIMATSVIA